MRLSGVMVKSPSITSSDVSTHFRPVLKSRLGGLTFAEAPPSAISRFNWSPESTKARRLFEAPREDDSSFRADLEQSTSNERAFMKFVSLTKPIAEPHQIHSYTELRQQIHDDLRIQHPEWVQQMANPPCVILTRRVSWNCSALDAKGDPTSLSLSSSRPRTGTNFPDKTQGLGCDLLRIAFDSINTRFLYEQGS